MNGVIGMTELLFGTTLTDRQRYLAETVHRSATALLDIINDILDFSKIEAGKLQLEQMDFDLPRLFEEVAELFAEPVHRKGLELLCRIDEAVPVRLNGDPVRLRQILINLLSNAVKFTERGEVVLSVDLVEARRDETLLRFNVKDSGVGVPPDAQQRIFRAFDQADSSTTRKYGGTGLGLAIVNRLVELMGGMIGIESVPGEGSTFWFVIPLGISTQPPMKVEQFLQARRLLVVDDNNTNRMILSHHLQQWGAASTGAESGAQALALLHRAAEDGLPFDAAILDMQMPGMDGLELARTIAAHPRLSSIRLVMLTSVGDQGGAANAVGVHLTLTKPVAQIRLREALTTLFVSGTVAPVYQAPSPLPVSLSGHVLLAEDNAVNREVALGMLEMLDCRVLAVEHGRLAIEAVAAQHFDLILMDCQMPEVDGFRATALIREHEASATPSRHIPIVALTANAMEGDRARCLAAGMDDYLSKPFTLQSLQDMLSRWIPVKSTGLPPVSHPATPRKTEPPETTSFPEPLPELLDTQAWKAILALQRPGQPDLLAKILGLYLKDSYELVDKIQAAVTDRNARLLQEAAHSLKSRSATLGAHQLAQLCQQLELAGRTQSFKQTEQRVDQLTKVFAETCALFRQELKGRAA